MKRLLPITAFLVTLAGCGPAKRDVAQSEVERLADTWDGGPNFTATGTDPWGEPYTAQVEKDEAFYYLTVRSNGPDRLPKTRDDVVATRSKKHTPISQAVAPAVERIGQALGKGLGRGGVEGVKEGFTGKKPEEKNGEGKGEAKKPEAKKE
jgi:hypothetical protein